MAKASGAGAVAPQMKADTPSGRAKQVTYDEDLGKAICDRLAAGEAWNAICKEVGMPSYKVLYVWAEKYPAFGEAVRQARQAGADHKADEALEVARNATRESLATDRLLISTLLRHAARTAPRAWGPRNAAAEGKAPDERVIVVRVRDFVPVTRPDGTVFTREILPGGGFRDYDR